MNNPRRPLATANDDDDDNNHHHHDDTDLDDLLHEDHVVSSQRRRQQQQPPTTQHQYHLEMTPLNLDYLTREPQEWGNIPTGVVSSTRTTTTFATSTATTATCWETLQDVCTYWAYAHPRKCACCTVGTLLLVLVLTISTITNPTMEFGNVGHIVLDDYNNNNKYNNHDRNDLQHSSRWDVQLGKVDHWCLRGDDDSCRCEDPLVPTARGEFATWRRAHSLNVKSLEEFRRNDGISTTTLKPTRTNMTTTTTTVAIIGESLVEEMNGRWMGQDHGPSLHVLRTMFDQKLNTPPEANNYGIRTIPLGIAGDTSPNVLWRIQHGEMPTWFNPDVVWLSLGMNDLGRMECSEQVVILGILRVVEEILNSKPTVRVVINSMLPMADLRGDLYPTIQDYQDAFRIRNHKASRYVKKPPPAPLRPRSPPSGADATNAAASAAGSSSSSSSSKNKNGQHVRRRRRRSLLSWQSSRDYHEYNTSERRVEEEQRQQQYPQRSNRNNNSNNRKNRRRRKDPLNPLLDPFQTKMKKYKLLWKRNRLPLWTSIYAMNRELRSYCQTQDDRVSFFDATNIFAQQRGSKYMLRSDMISIRGHPTVAGFSAWEDAIVKKLRSMAGAAETASKGGGDKNDKEAAQTTDENQSAATYTIDMNKDMMMGGEDDEFVESSSESNQQDDVSSSSADESSSKQ